MAYAARPLADRLIDRVTLDENDCWLWEGSADGGGYGQLWVGSKRQKTWRLGKTHRVAYELFRGAIPQGMELDHLCRVRRCANPWHLEIVTHRENVRRGNSPTMLLSRANVCKRGHSLADAYIQNGRRACRPCKVAVERARRAARKNFPNLPIKEVSK